jgi:hypothetical protein
MEVFGLIYFVSFGPELEQPMINVLFVLDINPQSTRILPRWEFLQCYDFEQLSYRSAITEGERTNFIICPSA